MCQEGHFETQDGISLFERRWQPDSEARADLILLHGYGEHSGRYGHVAKALQEIGITVHTYDQRGFGRSPGKRGYIRNFDTLLDDLDVYLDHVRGRLEDKPRFVMGHSMGGLIMVRYAQTRGWDVRGLIFSSPFLAITADVSRLLVALAGLLGTLTPWLPVATMDTTGVARDPSVVEAYDADPLNFHGRILARTGAELNAAVRAARAGFETVTAPAYIIHGADDRLVPAEGSRLLHDGCRSQDKTLKIYEGGYHELLNDLDKQAVIADLKAWLTARI